MQSQNLKLSVKIEGIEKVKGELRVGLYNNGSNFPDKKNALTGKVQPIKNNIETVIFDNLKPGIYAVAVIHDENKDGELTTNFIGIPKEGYGFSNNAMGTMGPPSFEKAAVKMTKNEEIVIQLRN